MPKTTFVRKAQLNTRRATNITAPASMYAALFTIAPVVTTKAAVAAGTTIGAQTVTLDKWALYRLSINAAGTITVTPAADNVAGYANEAAAIAALPVLPALGTDMGYLTILTASGLAWIAGTDALAGGTTGNEAQTTNYYPATTVTEGLTLSRGTTDTAIQSTAFAYTSTGTEVAGASYARQLMTFAAPDSGDLIDNTVEVAFPVASSNYPGDTVGWGAFDTSTAGNLWDFGFLGGVLTDFCALAATDVFTSVGHAFSDTISVVLTGNSLPGGFTAGTKYFVRDVSGNTFKLAATSGGTAIDVTSDGSGQIQTDLRKTVTTGDQVKFAAGDMNIIEK